MDTNIDFSKILKKALQSLGYSDKLANRALQDLEKVIAVRYYNKIISLLPPNITKKIKSDDYHGIILLAKENLDQTTLQDYLYEITKEVISEYIALVGNI